MEGHLFDSDDEGYMCTVLHALDIQQGVVVHGGVPCEILWFDVNARDMFGPYLCS